MFFRTRLSIATLYFTGFFLGYSQSKTYELNGENDDDLYPYMLYWKDFNNDQNSLNKAVYNLEKGNFKAFDSVKGKNLELVSKPVWFYIRVKNISKDRKNYWWTFYSHADTIIIYEKQKLQWIATDTLLRNKILYQREIKHRALTHQTRFKNGQEKSYLVKIVNPRHTQNSFISLTTPRDHLLWENGFYWTVGSFIGVFLLTGIVSLIIGIVTIEWTFILFFIYMLIISVLTLYNELMIPVVKNKTLFFLLNRLHPLPLSLIATCLNFYIANGIFRKVNNSKFIVILNLLNNICLIIGSTFLILYMLFTNNLHSGQTLFLLGWYGVLSCIFISIFVTTLKICILSFEFKKFYLGIPFLLLIMIVNPATYNLNYSGIFSFYEITYPNYFYWFVSTEFIFMVFLIGWRYKKNLEHRHKLQIEYAKRELYILNEERKQIARDLHDELGATINTIKLLVTNSYPKDRRLIEIVTIASNDIRIFHNKLSDKKNDRPLKASVKKLVKLHNSYEQIKFKCIFTGDENLLSKIQKENIYKIINETFTNILKHAQATEVTIQLMIEEVSAELIVEDNGIGFSVKQAIKTKGMGIKNIHQRVLAMNGKLHISSGKGNTTYIINIPINNE